MFGQRYVIKKGSKYLVTDGSVYDFTENLQYAEQFVENVAMRYAARFNGEAKAVRNIVEEVE